MKLEQLPAFHPAGSVNVLMHIAALSGGAYIEQPTQRGWSLGTFLIGLAIGALVAVGVMLG